MSTPGFRVALVLERYPEVKMKGEEDLARVREAVAGAVDNLPDESASTPRLKDSYLTRGTMVAVCDDMATQNWLAEVAASFELPKGLRLRVVSREEL